MIRKFCIKAKASSFAALLYTGLLVVTGVDEISTLLVKSQIQYSKNGC